MAADDWEEIYGTYSDTELAEEIAWLKEESKSIYISQGQGGKSFSRSLSDLTKRLNSAVRVQAMKSGQSIGEVRKVAVDFSEA
jgi:hypothetical protein